MGRIYRFSLVVHMLWSSLELAGTLIPGHGWMISKKSVAKYLEEEAAKTPGVGFPRGRSRKPEPAKPKAKVGRGRKVARS